MNNIGKILIIDDEVENTEIIKDMLEDVNYLVHTADSVEVAKKIILEVKFDLIMLDVWMPKVDGMSFLKELKSDNNPTKVVMMSGHAEHNDIVEAIKLGAIDFIKKPIYDILPVIRKILASTETKTTTNFDKNLKDARVDFEKSYFNHHLNMENNNISKVAQISGIERTTLYRKLKELGINK